ncbi:hypothetical protein C4585_00200 [Candidatus Parcubacteria bacterium]|nr:MAG: hypothetical protein C4585_00200 [Candidatus Parcubacteria bacterium]
MLTGPIQELLRKVEAAEAAEQERPSGSEILEVNKMIAKAATFYEKVRYLIDYREEHTIRRAAMERILKRRIFIEHQTHVGMTLLQELADGQYLEKGEATEEAAHDIDKIVWKYLNLIESARANGTISRWLISFAATEIDARLSPKQYAVDDAAAEAFYKITKGRAAALGVSEEEVNIQLYCAIWRSLISADNERLSYALWILYMPEWKNPDFNPKTMAGKLPGVIAHIQAAVHNQLQWQIASKLKNESIYFHIIRDIVQHNGAAAEHILGSDIELEEYTQSYLAKKYERENARIRSSGIRAVAYLFLTKMVVALLVEVPYEYIFLGSIHYFPLSVNILFHPLLLFVLTRRVGALDDENTKAIIDGVKNILYEGKTRSIRIRNTYTRLTFAFATMYLILVLLVFGTLIGFLELLNFNPVSIALFLFFLALVSYFAFRIRFQAQRWKVVRNQGTLSVIASVLAIPVIRTGRWLSQTFSSINVFVIILDFIIETPFKRLLNFSNQFLYYLREKAEEMR